MSNQLSSPALAVHTPGPWSIARFPERGPSRIIAAGGTVAEMPGWFPADVEHANATLIRAAPTLLTELRAQTDVLRTMLKTGSFLPDTTRSLLHEFISNGEAAIALAEGRTQ